MSRLMVRTPARRYRLASREEVCAAAAAYLIAELPADAYINNALAAQALIRTRLAGLDREAFAVLFLNNRHGLIAFEVMFCGDLDKAAVYVRPIVRRALELNAAAVVLAHNHPSGLAEPSTADELITRRLKEALALVDVRVIDHVIVTSTGGFLSFSARGLL